MTTHSTPGFDRERGGAAPAFAAVPVFMHATSMVSALGLGRAAHAAALREGRTGLRDNDFAPAAGLATAIGRVDAVEGAGLPAAFRDVDCRNHRLAELALAHDGVEAAIAAAVRRHGAARVGVVVGSSTSGILSTELLARGEARRSAASRGAVSQADASRGSPAPALAFPAGLYEGSQSMFATARYLRRRLGLAGPALTLSTACSSSAKAFIVARRWLRAQRVDAVVVCGADSLALSTLYGFRALQLLAAERCRPFAATRAGISIGEAAAIALVSREASDIALEGAGESSDAHHMSTPPPDGEGARRAMHAALDDAGIDARQVGYVNLHGTGTPINDAAEAAAVRAVHAASTPCSSTKGATGHALGAAGALEALLVVEALRAQWLPANVGGEAPDETLGLAFVRAPRGALFRHAMSNSFGFGGSNCALVLGLR